MTSGTIVMIGTVNREAELLSKRLEREGFTVTHFNHPNQARKWLGQNVCQAVLFSQRVSANVIKNTINMVLSIKRNRWVPFLVITESDMPLALQNIPNLGEALPLHSIPISQAIARLQRAVQLSQMTLHLGLA